MEENKKGNKSLIVAVVILSILVIALGGYICYDKVISNNNDEQKESNKNNKVEEKDDNTNNDDDNTNNDDDNTNNDDDNTNDNSVNFDFNELSSTLHSSIQKDNITTFITKCENKTVNQGEPPETEESNIEVSSNTIDTIINKLKTAKSIDKEITYSWFDCPPKSITYYISVNSTDKSEVHSQRVFSLNYANGEDILLVGYNNKGYAFHFNSSEEISGFIESLK